MQILELLTQRKFVSAMCDAHSNAHARIIIIIKKKVCHAHFKAYKPSTNFTKS